MKVWKLYLVLVLSVLGAACGSGSSQRSEPDDAAASENEAENRPATSAEARPVVLFLGNSLSAGAGVDETDSFPALIRERVDSLDWPFRIVNAGLSGETTSGGLRRIDWLLNQPIRVLILELGGNDGLRGVPIEVTRDNLEQIILKTRAAYPDVEIVLAGMQIPPNLGHEYTERFRAIYPDLAEEQDVHLIPFLLEGVGGVDSLMQGDGIHPTESGHRIVAENVWEVLGPVLQDLRDGA